MLLLARPMTAPSGSMIAATRPLATLRASTATLPCEAEALLTAASTSSTEMYGNHLESFTPSLRRGTGTKPATYTPPDLASA